MATRSGADAGATGRQTGASAPPSQATRATSDASGAMADRGGTEGRAMQDAQRQVPVSREGTQQHGARAETRGRTGGLRTAGAFLPGQFRGALPMTPWALMRRMSEELDQLFESLGGARGGLAPAAQAGEPASSGTRTATADFGAPAAAWVPRIEVLRRPNAIVVRADVSGVNPNDIEVSVEDRLLTISGERRQEEREEEEPGLIRSELSYGAFYRAIPLPEGSDEERIIATFRNGVLEITIPVSEQQAGRRIPVQS